MISRKTKYALEFKNLLLPIFVIIIFSLIGIAVFLYKQRLIYFFLFAGIGLIAGACGSLTILFPEKKQAFRRTTQVLVGGGLFLGLSLRVNVNFQFSEVIFDIFALVATGAIIQFVIARLIMPFIIGNAFCSWVCWDGAIFELAENVIPKSKNNRKRSVVTAFSYLAVAVIIAGAVALYGNPALDESKRFWWIVGENAFILSLGIILSVFLGRRAYCRMLCPFLSVSGLISKYSIFKIKPVNAEKCTGCNRCSKACPMLIDVSGFVKNGKSINSRNCIICEQCVSSCENNCLKLVPGLPWR
jgi:ferredoxin-type protein NapH